MCLLYARKKIKQIYFFGPQEMSFPLFSNGDIFSGLGQQHSVKEFPCEIF